MKRCWMVVIVMLLLTGSCRAQEQLLLDELELDKLSEAGVQYDTGVEFSRDMDLDRGLKQLAERAGEHLPRALRTGLRSAVLLLAVVLLCGMADGMRAAGIGTDSLNVCVMAGALAITAISANDMSTMMGLGRSTIDSMQGFARVLLPVTAVCSALAGGAAGAAVRQTATTLFLNLLLTLIDRLLVPLVYAYVAAFTAYAAVGNQGLKKLAQVLKWVVTRSLTALLLFFVTYLTVSGTLAGTTDAAVLKTAKTAIATVVPVVGGIISNAAQTLLVGAGAMKNTVGLFGFLAVLGICLTPFLQLGVHYLTYKMSGTLAATIADKRLAELIEGIGTAFSLVLGMTGSSALLILINIMSALTGGAA